MTASDPVAEVRKLVDLATGSTNPNESRNAAMQACTRIKSLQVKMLLPEELSGYREREELLLDRIRQLEIFIRSQVEMGTGSGFGRAVTPEKFVDMGAKAAGSAVEGLVKKGITQMFKGRRPRKRA